MVDRPPTTTHCRPVQWNSFRSCLFVGLHNQTRHAVIVYTAIDGMWETDSADGPEGCSEKGGNGSWRMNETRLLVTPVDNCVNAIIPFIEPRRSHP